MIIETIGYIGSGIVLVSFLMTSVKKLRIVNTVGSVIFMIYALIIHSYPTAIMNLCLALINLRFLWKMRHTGNQYELVEVDSRDRYLQYLQNKYRDDILKCFPGVEHVLEREPGQIGLCYIVTCAGAPAGIVLANHDSPETLDLLLDYSLPEYRDFSIGAFLADQLKTAGIRTLTYGGPTENHMDYLNKMGFRKQDGIYVKDL